MANNTILIDEVEAEQDKKNINTAIEHLNNSLEKLKNLRSVSSEMDSKTTKAITEKCTVLEQEITSMITKLTNTEEMITSIVNSYHKIDDDLANKMKRS